MKLVTERVTNYANFLHMRDFRSAAGVLLNCSAQFTMPIHPGLVVLCVY